MSSPICIELKRSPDLQSMHTPPAAEAGLESEKFIECDVGDGGTRVLSALTQTATSLGAESCAYRWRHAANLRERRTQSIAVFWQLTQRGRRLAPILRGVSSPKHKSRLRN